MIPIKEKKISRTLRINKTDGSFQDLELKSFNVIEKGRPSIWIGGDKDGKYHLTIAGGLIQDFTEVSNFEIIRKENT